MRRLKHSRNPRSRVSKAKSSGRYKTKDIPKRNRPQLGKLGTRRVLGFKRTGEHKLDAAIERCSAWAKSIQSILGARAIYIFGSTIYRNGVQYDPTRSDLDIILMMPRELDSPPRKVHWFIKLREQKQDLELSLIPLLGRSDAARPIVSIVPLTQYELERDIHKSASRNFFRENVFINLLRNTGAVRLLNRAPLRVNEFSRQVLEFVQGTRNKFLSISASGTCFLSDWDDPFDPLPKELMRYAAMATRMGADSTFDVQAGLDEITNYVFSKRESHEMYSAVNDWVSVRRKARGKTEALSPENYLLLAESIAELLRLKTRRTQATRAGSSKNEHKRRKSIKNDFTSKSMTFINGYKLFYFRVNHKLTHKRLAQATGLEAKHIRQLEKVRPRRGELKPSLWFANCDRQTLHLLEETLDCHGKLEIGKPDDFLTQFMMFYEMQRGRGSGRSGNHDHLELNFQTKAVVFDFDGTLTKPTDDKTTWEKVWAVLGYSLEQCFQLHRRFQRKEFTHQEWCNITCDAFRSKNLRDEHIEGIASEMALIDGVSETILELRRRGIKLYILSGSIKSLIRKLLGPLCSEFEEIRANELVFDQSGVITEIQGTPFDFEGKALFIKRLIEELKIRPADILFVGNSCNDVFASQSGARTLCVNARFTDPDNEEHWTYAIRKMVSLSEILRFVEI